MAPFLSEKTVRKLFEEVIKHGSVDELQMIAPFVEEEAIDKLFK